jgi:mycofactocin glycosyltransferase
LLSRRYRYGLSAGALERRHPGRLAPVVVHSWSGLVVCAVLARRPWLAAGALGVSAAALGKTLGAADIDRTGASIESVHAAWQTWRQLGRTVTQFASPLLVVGLLFGRRRRLLLAALALGAPVTEWLEGPVSSA